MHLKIPPVAALICLHLAFQFDHVWKYRTIGHTWFQSPEHHHFAPRRPHLRLNYIHAEKQLELAP